MICLRLFWEYFKIGLFAVGGGMGTVPFLYDLADKTGWFTHAQLADMLAVAQSVPAAMGVNLASHKRMAFIISSFFAGISGALLAMYQASVQAVSFKAAMTYEILLIVVIGGIGSVSGSIIASSCSSAAPNGCCAFWITRPISGASGCRCCARASAWWCSASSSCAWCCSSAAASWATGSSR